MDRPSNSFHWSQALTELVDFGIWSDLKPCEQAVLIVYLVRSNRGGESWYGTGKILAQSGVSMRAFRNAVKSLVGRGLISTRWSKNPRDSAVVRCRRPEGKAIDWNEHRCKKYTGAKSASQQVQKILPPDAEFAQPPMQNVHTEPTQGTLKGNHNKEPSSSAPKGGTQKLDDVVAQLDMTSKGVGRHFVGKEEGAVGWVSDGHSKYRKPTEVRARLAEIRREHSGNASARKGVEAAELAKFIGLKVANKLFTREDLDGEAVARQYELALNDFKLGKADCPLSVMPSRLGIPKKKK